MVGIKVGEVFKVQVQVNILRLSSMIPLLAKNVIAQRELLQPVIGKK